MRIGHRNCLNTKKELSNTKKKLSKKEKFLKKALRIILKLQQKILNFKNRHKKNSKNSSNPPSTDQKANTKDKPKKKIKKRKGKNRQAFTQEEIDQSIECTQSLCPDCKSKDIKSLSLDMRLQQVELPDVKSIVIEYILKKYHCDSCGFTFYADPPKGVAPSSFGPKLMGLLATLTGVFHLSKREAIQLIKDLYNIDIGLGSVTNIEEKISKSLDPVYQRIHSFILTSQLSKHFDETTWRNSGKRHYVWIATCNDAAVYKIDRYRNTLAFQKLIKDTCLKGQSYVSDRYSLYKNLGGKHQFCLAHLIRDFKYFSERDGPDKKTGQEIEKSLSTACFIHGKYRDGKIKWKMRNKRLDNVRRKVKYWLKKGVNNGSEQLSGLSQRLLKEFANIFMFIKVKGMEPTNNLAERDLRKLVIWRKKSYGTKSKKGKTFVETITTVAQTLRKQRKNVLKFIQSTIKHFYYEKDPPLINPDLKF